MKSCSFSYTSCIFILPSFLVIHHTDSIFLRFFLENASPSAQLYFSIGFHINFFKYTVLNIPWVFGNCAAQEPEEVKKRCSSHFIFDYKAETVHRVAAGWWSHGWHLNPDHKAVIWLKGLQDDQWGCLPWLIARPPLLEPHLMSFPWKITLLVSAPVALDPDPRYWVLL